MTREEAIGHIKDVICENNTIKPNIVVFEQEKEALYMAIKELEQEPIIDKIRAEIEFEVDHRTNMLCAEDVFAILDKYKAENEDKE